MTHDELLLKAVMSGDTSTSNALRAVVELHKPVKENETETYCFDCQLDEYPCPTIQAIEKELK